MTETKPGLLFAIRNGKKGDPLSLDTSAARTYRRTVHFDDIQPGNSYKLGRKINGNNGEFLREIVIPGGHSFLVDGQGNTFGSYSEDK